MALTSLGLFCLEAAAGTALLLIFFPTRDLGGGFFSLHGLIALLFLLFAALSRPPGLPMTLAWTAAALLAVYTLAAHAGKAAFARPILAAGALVGLWCLVRAALALPRGEGAAWIAAGVILGGLFLGAVLLIMNLGHWYLVSRSLPFQLLARGAILYAALAAARTTLLAVAVAAHWGGESVATLLSPEREGVFFLFRVLWGIAGPLALSYFIWKTAHMRSNQATTGLLYVALVFVLIGELLSSYLTVATGFPA
jgi:protein NrfD